MENKDIVEASEVVQEAPETPKEEQLSLAQAAMPAQLESKRGKLDAVRSFINSPWVFIALPLLVGGIWLVNNTWLITNNLDHPYALAAGPATIGSILLVWFVINFFKTIASWCKSAWALFLGWRKRDGSTFWLVIAVFLAVSVLESGTFFNELLGPNSLFGTLGYASAFVIDLVSVECMRARQAAVRMRDGGGERLYQIGVIICALLSAFANGYTALQHFVEPTNTLIPILMIKVAPAIGVIFPLLMVFLSFAGDYTADQSNTKLDPEQYEKAEHKRIRLLEIQRDKLKARVQIEHDIDLLAAKMAGNKEKRTFFLVNWFFPKNPLSMSMVVENVVEEMKKLYDPQMQILMDQNKQLQSHLQGFIAESHQVYAHLGQSLREDIGRVKAENEGDIDLLIQRLEAVKRELISGTQNQLKEIVSQQRLQTTNTPTDPGYYPSSKQLVNQDQKTNKPLDKESGDMEDVVVIDEEIRKALIDYPIFLRTLSTGVRSISIEDIIQTTGHTPQLVRRREKNGVFKKTRREGLYTITSVITWLKSERLPARSQSPNAPMNGEGNTTDLVPQKEAPKRRNTQPLYPENASNIDSFADPITEPNLVGIGE